MAEKETKLTGEEIAKIEIGHTDITRGVGSFLVVMFLLVICIIPTLQFIRDSRTLRKPSEKPEALSASTAKPAPSAKALHITTAGVIPIPDLWNRIQETNSKMLGWIQNFEKDLEDTTFLNDWPVPYLKILLVGFLHAGTEDVYNGRDNWLFFRPDIDYLTGKGFMDPEVLEMRRRGGKQNEEPPQPDPVKAILEFRAQLAERGVQLLVLPAPPKSVVYPDMFSKRFAGPSEMVQNPSFKEFEDRLEKEGIKVFDAADLLIQERNRSKDLLYLKTDTHWSPTGVEIIAQKLAEHIEQYGIPRSASSYQCQSKQVTNTGDLANMLRLPEKSNPYPPETTTISQVSMANGQPWRADNESEILFLGDSFCNIYSLAGMGWGDSAGLVERFSYHMGLPVDRLLINDKGSFSTRRELSRQIAQGTDRLAGKKLVIYEFAARELAQGDWKTNLSIVAKSSARTELTTKTEQTISVTGTIRQITRSPEPGSVPYKDCIIAFHLSEVVVEKGQMSDKEIVVFAWGMRDNKAAKAAKYRSGDRVKLDLLAWERVQDTYGSFNRVELDSDDLLLLPLFWSADIDSLQ